MQDLYIQRVYESLWGLLEEDYHIQGVEDMFAPGEPCAELYSDVLGASERLRHRLHSDSEDPDVEIIINSLLEISRRVGMQMYRCGSRKGSFQ